MKSNWRELDQIKTNELFVKMVRCAVRAYVSHSSSWWLQTLLFTGSDFQIQKQVFQVKVESVSNCDHVNSQKCLTKKKQIKES